MDRITGIPGRRFCIKKFITLNYLVKIYLLDGGLEMYIQTEFEFSLVLSTERFNRLMEMSAGRIKQIGENMGVDQSLISKGIVVTYHDRHKKKVQLNVKPNITLDDDKPETDKLNKRIGGYFGADYTLDEFKLTYASFTTDIDVGSQEKVVAYLKVLQRVGKVKGVLPPSGNSLDDDLSFCLVGNNNRIEFCIYDLEGLLQEQLSRSESGRKELKTLIERATGLLRAEVRLTKPKALRAYTKETSASEQIADLTGRAEEIFLDTFKRVVPFGDFYKIKAVTELIRKKVTDTRLKRKMLRLVELIPKKKSLWLAKKAMNDRNIDEVIEKFAELEVSPVTISKRHDVKHLKSLHSYLKN
jgi:hypothetical protein